jgi:8-amino-7-oxononanoate synthase
MDSLVHDLQTLEAKHLKRTLKSVEFQEGARLTINGKSFLNFSSNNYLGLARHPQVLEAVQQVLPHWGVGAQASRLISGNSVIHQDLEQALAAFMKTEAALVFPTGYMTNLGVITALAGTGDAVILDRLCHASLIDAARLSGARLFVYAHADVAEAERALERAASYRRRLLVTDSLFSMDGDFAPLAELAALAQRHKAISVLDEAHAVGIWGTNGRGIREGSWDVVVGTLSKSLGSQGGFACASQTVIETLINKSRSFIYTTGLSPACVAGAQAALSLIQEDSAPRERLKSLSKRLREGLRSLKFNVLNSESQIIPILLGNADRAMSVAAHLEASGIYAPAIRPPTVHAGECRIRFSVTAEHQEADIDFLLQNLGNIPSPQPSPGKGEGPSR